jgi:1-deoxy-D-xylulose-5-phosphate reductoisomerase
MKKVLIFGSTGSIGKNALEVIKKNRKGFRVLGLCAYSDTDTLISQVKEFSPAYVCVVDQDRSERLEKVLGKKVKIFKGQKGLEEFSSIECDISLMAIGGVFCLKPLLINMKYAKRIALANKESLVVAGSFVFSRANRFNTEILPVDSEINALFQLFKNEGNPNRVYITASGGPLLDYKKRDLAKVRVNTVLSHPTWKMGKRISVDSATLINKGFEVVETHYFFNLPYEKIDIVIHRESTIHALVELKDKTIFACLYPPDMKIPISFALHYPLRYPSYRGIDFKDNFSFTFEPIDYKKFSLLGLILEAAKKKDNSLAILNACDELAIDYFLKNKIKFIHLYKVMEHIFKHYPSERLKNIGDVFYWDSWARRKTKEYLDRLC